MNKRSATHLVISLAASALASAGCVEEQASFFIEDVVAAPTEPPCEVNVGDPGRFAGLLDVGGLPNEANSYEGIVRVVTNLPATLSNQNLSEDRTRSPNYPNYGPSDNNVITMKEVRVYFTDARQQPLPVGFPGEEVTPDNPRITTLGGTVYNTGTQLNQKGLALATLITAQEARALQQLANPDLAQNPELSALAASPDNRATIFVNFQIGGRTTGGAEVLSPEFTYPIELCQRCLVNVGMEPGQPECPAGQELCRLATCNPGQDALSSFCLPSPLPPECF